MSFKNFIINQPFMERIAHSFKYLQSNNIFFIKHFIFIISTSAVIQFYGRFKFSTLEETMRRKILALGSTYGMFYSRNNSLLLVHHHGRHWGISRECIGCPVRDPPWLTRLQAAEWNTFCMNHDDSAKSFALFNPFLNWIVGMIRRL